MARTRSRPDLPTDLKRRPWLKFYVADWRANVELRRCGLAARGLWADMLTLMHDATPYGHLVDDTGGPMPTAVLAHLIAAPVADVEAALAELERRKVLSRTDSGVIYSRRMVKDARRAAIQQANGGLGGNPQLGGDYATPGFVYCAERHDGRIKIGISRAPAKRLYKIRQQLEDPTVSMLDTAQVPNMNAALAELYAGLDYAQRGDWLDLNINERQDLSAAMLRLKGNNSPHKGKAAIPHKGRPSPDVRPPVRPPHPSTGLNHDGAKDNSEWLKPQMLDARKKEGSEERESPPTASTVTRDSTAAGVEDHGSVTEAIVDGFLALRERHWPSSPAMAAPLTTLRTQAAIWASWGATPELALSVMDTVMRQNVLKGDPNPPTHLRFCERTLEPKARALARDSGYDQPRAHPESPQKGEGGEADLWTEAGHLLVTLTRIGTAEAKQLGDDLDRALVGADLSAAQAEVARVRSFLQATGRT